MRAARACSYDATIDRVIRVHTESLEHLPYTRRQLDRREDEHPSTAERQSIRRICGEVNETEQLLHEVLALAREISAGTIDKILGMGDFDLGWAAIAGTLPGARPNRATPRSELPGDADPECLAAQIDARMAELQAAGLDGMAIFMAMLDHMPMFKRLMDTMLRSVCVHSDQPRWEGPTTRPCV